MSVKTILNISAPQIQITDTYSDNDYLLTDLGLNVKSTGILGEGWGGEGGGGGQYTPISNNFRNWLFSQIR